MRSLKQPALVANLRTFPSQTSHFDGHTITHHFLRFEHRATPRRRRSGSTIETLTTYGVAELHTRIVRVYDGVDRGSREALINHAPWSGELR